MTPPATRRALVTGGTRGIGAAVAKALIEAGYETTVTGRAPGGKGPSGCRYAACDFTQPGQVERLAAQAAELELSVLVNNAGINHIGPVAEYSPDEFLKIQQVNMVAPFLLCRAVVPGMRRRRYGRIINITSIFAVVSRSGRGAYSASKSGLAGFSRALALEVAADNVLVNCVAPGFVDTELTRRSLGESGLAEMAARVPMRRLAEPDEIARYVRFLASEENTYMTGQQMIVDGGFVSE